MMNSIPREYLENLQKTGNYVFHGSGYDIEKFEPMQAYTYIQNEQIPDGEPAIFASPYYEYAWFMAIINDVNCPNGFLSSSGSHDGMLTFLATKETLEQLTPESKGFIYVFPKSDFLENDEFEYYSPVARTYLEKIEVSYADFPASIQIRKT